MGVARQFADKASVFGANEEVTELLAKVEAMALEYGARALQYAESALSYAVGHLEDPASKMEPGSMRKILKDNLAEALYQSGDVQKALWTAANRLVEA